MKRTVCTFLTAAAIVGCQSPAGVAQRGHSDMGFSQHIPAPAAKGARAAKSPNGDIVQAGYNAGRGAIQNRSFNQRIARAVPSHGGQVPGNPNMRNAGMQSAGMGAGPGCPGCAQGMGAAHAGMMPGMGAGHAGMMNGMGLGPRFRVGRSQVRFVKPTDMQIAWASSGADASGGFTPPQLRVPARYNFTQARIYRLKISDISYRDDMVLYPTLEVYPGNSKIDAYLAHNAVPIEFTDEDFDQVLAGNYVTKVIYLPDPEFQELAIPGVETLVSTRLDPGVDPVQEAHRRGAVLAVVRLGSVNLEMAHSPPLLPQPPMPVAAMRRAPAKVPSLRTVGKARATR